MSVASFDLAVIGAGSGGLVAAAAAAQFGQKVVLFEKGEMGGECLNTGCVPSKALLAAARQAQALRSGARYGIAAVEPQVDYAAVRTHVQRAIAAIEPHDSQQRMEGLGVTVIRAAARFVEPRTLEAQGQRFAARRIVIATGSRPAVPPIPGLAQLPFLTNETLFGNPILPTHLIVLGGGPVGIEMAQAHRRLGSTVTIIEAATPLAQDDPELTAVVLDQLRAEGVEILSGTRVASASATQAITVTLADGRSITGSHLLVAAGRKPNVEDLGLETAGIVVTPAGITVDRRMRTTNPRVFAIGDVAGGHFTHEAGYQAGIVIRNALFGLAARATAAIPHAIYTDPELAQVGLTEQQARAACGDGVRVLRAPFHDNDRAIAEASTLGLIKIVTSKRGRILGAGITGAGAGELIQPWVLALERGLGISTMAGSVLPYPTRGEAGRRAATDYFANLASSPLLRRVLAVVRMVRP